MPAVQRTVWLAGAAFWAFIMFKAVQQDNWINACFCAVVLAGSLYLTVSVKSRQERAKRINPYIEQRLSDRRLEAQPGLLKGLAQYAAWYRDFRSNEDPLRRRPLQRLLAASFLTSGSLLYVAAMVAR